MNLFSRLSPGLGTKALAVFTFFVCAMAQAQYKPGQVTLAGEQFYEYPYRINERSEEIPPCAYNLPNGKYIGYINYRFRTINKKGDRKLIAKDTSIICAIFTLENNKPTGSAYFYDCNLRSTSGKKKLNKWYTSGHYADGLKDGEWINKWGHTVYLSHYKNGLKHGSFTEWAGNGKTYNTYYLDDEYVGYVNNYDGKGHLIHRYYYDTLHMHDSSFSYTNGKIYYATDMVRNAPPRTKEGIWKTVLQRFTYMNVHGKRNGSVFTFYRNYDITGKLETEVQLKYPGSFYFDSLLVNNHRITIKEIGCPDGNAKDTCYEVVSKNILHANDMSIYYYRNDFIYKTINIWPNLKTGADTSISLNFEIDSSRIWQFQPTSVFSSRTYTTTMYNLPAISYSYEVESNGERTESYSHPSRYVWSFYRKKSNYEYKPTYYHIPVRIDSVHNQVTFMDTTNDIKTGISFVSTTLRRSYPRIPSQRTYIDIDYEYDPLEGDFDSDILLGNEIHRPTDDLYNGVYNLSFQIDPYQLCSDNMQYINPYIDYFNEVNNPPELMLKANAPYTGMAFIHKGKTTKYNSKKSLLSLGSSFINSDYTYNAKGMYKEGRKDGVWEFLEQKEGLGSGADFKNVFLTNKKHEFYSTATYSQGQLNGPKSTYLKFIPEIWDESYFYFKGKPVKYLDNTLNYAYGELHGPATYYHPNNKVKCSLTYKNRLIDGEVVKYNFNGQPIYRADFKDDKLNGPLATYDYVSLKPVVKAHFTDGRLNGVLEMMNDGDKWLEAKADTGYLVYKKLFYEKNVLKEEIRMDAGASYKLRPLLLQSENFLSYSPNIPKKTKMRYSYERRARRIGRADSLNNLKFYGNYKSYYNTGQLYCQGRIEKMRPAGNWEFYDIGGTVINRITFKDSVFIFSDTGHKQNILGTLTGYYGNGKLRCRAYVTALDVSYDCNTHADLSAFELILTDNYDYYGIDNCTGGTGLVKQYNESGVLQAQGRIEKHMKTGLWKYYDPNGKLNKIGTYVNDLEDGTWLTGDLEGFNYENAACFDRNNEEDMKKFLYNQKNLSVTKSIYKKGELIRDDDFYIDMNKE